ncbi:MAG: DUF4041 domain-containing protein, partial [Cytophagaceae bacterium]
MELIALIALIAGIATVVLLIRSTKANGKVAQLTLELNARKNDLDKTEDEVSELRKQLQLRTRELERFKDIVDVEAEAARLSTTASSERNRLLQLAQSRVDQAETRLAKAIADADKIVATANERAQEIAGDAMEAMAKAKQYANAAKAMKNIIEGYGDAYIIPTYHL